MDGINRCRALLFPIPDLITILHRNKSRRGLKMPGQGRHEAVSVLFVIKDVGRDAHAAETGCDVDTFGCEFSDQLRRQAVLETEAQDMRRP